MQVTLEGCGNFDSQLKEEGEGEPKRRIHC